MQTYFKVVFFKTSCLEVKFFKIILITKGGLQKKKKKGKNWENIMKGNLLCYCLDQGWLAYTIMVLVGRDN